MNSFDFEAWFAQLSEKEKSTVREFMKYLVSLDPPQSESYSPMGEKIYKLCKSKLKKS